MIHLFPASVRPAKPDGSAQRLQPPPSCARAQPSSGTGQVPENGKPCSSAMANACVAATSARWGSRSQQYSQLSTESRQPPDRKGCCYPGRRRSSAQCARELNRRDPRPARKSPAVPIAPTAAPGNLSETIRIKEAAPAREVLLGAGEVAAIEAHAYLSRTGEAKARGAALALGEVRVSGPPAGRRCE